MISKFEARIKIVDIVIRGSQYRQYLEGWCVISGPFLLTWFNFNPGMDK